MSHVLFLFQGRHTKTGQLAAIKVMDVTEVSFVVDCRYYRVQHSVCTLVMFRKLLQFCRRQRSADILVLCYSRFVAWILTWEFFLNCHYL